jgi:hypothetical protein
MSLADPFGGIDWAYQFAKYSTFAVLAAVGLAIGWAASSAGRFGRSLGSLAVLIASACLPIVLYLVFPLFGMKLPLPLWSAPRATEVYQAALQASIVLHFAMWMGVLYNERKEDYLAYGRDGRPVGWCVNGVWRALRLGFIFAASAGIYLFAQRFLDGPL